MAKSQQMQAAYLRYIHEFLFSLNIALVAKLQGNQKPTKFFSALKFGESNLRFRINAYLHLYPHHHLGEYAAFFIYALGLALFIFLLLRILSLATLLRKSLYSIAGFVSLLLLPASWFYVSYLLGPLPFRPNPPYVLLFLELAGSIVCAALYLYSKWSLPVGIAVALLIFHFSLWGWLVFGSPYFWLDPFKLIFPIVGFCSTLVWGLNIAHQYPVKDQ